MHNLSISQCMYMYMYRLQKINSRVPEQTTEDRKQRLVDVELQAAVPGIKGQPSPFIVIDH